MTTQLADVDRLYQSIEGLVDADVLLPEEGAALLQALGAARSSLEACDAVNARRHVLQVASLADELVLSHSLGPAEGLAVVRAAGRILEIETVDGA